MLLFRSDSSEVSEGTKNARFSCGVMSLLKSFVNRERISSWVSVFSGSNIALPPVSGAVVERNGDRIFRQGYIKLGQLFSPPPLRRLCGSGQLGDDEFQIRTLPVRALP